MWVYSPIPCARDTPCFSATPWYTPSPSLVVGPPQQQRLQPQPRRYSIAPSQPEQLTEIARPEEEIHRIDTATAEAQQPQRKYLTTP